MSTNGPVDERQSLEEWVTTGVMLAQTGHSTSSPRVQAGCIIFGLERQGYDRDSAIRTVNEHLCRIPRTEIGTVLADIYSELQSTTQSAFDDESYAVERRIGARMHPQSYDPVQIGETTETVQYATCQDLQEYDGRLRDLATKMARGQSGNVDEYLPFLTGLLQCSAREMLGNNIYSLECATARGPGCVQKVIDQIVDHGYTGPRKTDHPKTCSIEQSPHLLNLTSGIYRNSVEERPTIVDEALRAMEDCPGSQSMH